MDYLFLLWLLVIAFLVYAATTPIRRKNKKSEELYRDDPDHYRRR